MKTPVLSKHRIYIHKYQNGYFINREPLDYQKAGWVAETRENLHKRLDDLLDAIEVEG